MRNIKVKIAYDGTNYSGWQIQNNGDTIQAKIADAIHKITGENSKIIAASRTDSGVHALGQVANFNLCKNIEDAKLKKAINHFLPSDISILELETANDDFNARYDARSKKYRYSLKNNGEKNPFIDKYCSNIKCSLDIDLIKDVSQKLVGTHDFYGFSSTGSERKNTVREIHVIDIGEGGFFNLKDSNDLWHIDVLGNGFLYHMVRNIVGVLIDIGRGKLPPNYIDKILKNKQASCRIDTAPAKGLCLLEVTCVGNGCDAT